jgi:hypothetical protein
MNPVKAGSESSQDNTDLLMTDSDTITQLVKNLSQQNSAGNVINYNIGCNIQSAASGRDIISTKTGNVSISNVYQKKWAEIKKEKNIDLSLVSSQLCKVG